MTVGFTGSRGYERVDFVHNFVWELAKKYPDVTVVSGGRGNVDLAAEAEAIDCGLTVVSYRPTDKHVEVWVSADGKPMTKTSLIMGERTFAGNAKHRNGYIAGSDRVVGFWDGKSRGTADCLSKAIANGKPIFVYGPEGELLLDVEGKVRGVLG